MMMRVGTMANSCYAERVRHTVQLEYSSAIVYRFQSPSLSSVDGVSDNHFRHEGRAF